jgi:hypothetical protein
MRPVLFFLLSGLLLSSAPLTAVAAQSPGDTIRLFLLPEEVVVGSFVERTPDAWRLAVQDRDPA